MQYGRSSAESSLEGLELFSFEPEAIAELSGFSTTLDDAGWVGDERLQPRNMRELLSLSAAEYSLLPLLAEPHSPKEPIRVGSFAARLAICKTDTMIEYPCRRDVQSGLSILDVVPFSADIERLAVRDARTEEGAEALAEAVRDLERTHIEHPNRLVRAVGEAGVIRLQGFLWAAKLMLNRVDGAEAVALAAAAFDLGELASS
jgi:hypothetical protein